MIISTTGLSRAQVLLALYVQAHKKLTALAKNRRTSYAGSGQSSKGYSLELAETAVKNHENRAKRNSEIPSYMFYEVHCGYGPLALNVCLLDSNQFDSTEFDDLYGKGAAQTAIDNMCSSLSCEYSGIDVTNLDARLDGPSLVVALEMRAKAAAAARSEEENQVEHELQTEGSIKRSAFSRIGRSGSLIFSNLSPVKTRNIGRLSPDNFSLSGTKTRSDGAQSPDEFSTPMSVSTSSSTAPSVAGTPMPPLTPTRTLFIRRKSSTRDLDQQVSTSPIVSAAASPAVSGGGRKSLIDKFWLALS